MYCIGIPSAKPLCGDKNVGMKENLMTFLEMTLAGM